MRSTIRPMLMALLVLGAISLVSATAASAGCNGPCSREQLATGLVHPPAWAKGLPIHFEAPSAAESPYSREELEGNGDPLRYKANGLPVQHAPKVYVIFWGSNVVTTERGREVRSMLVDLFNGLGGSAYQGILTQYFDETGRISSTVTPVFYTDESVGAPQALTEPAVEREVTQVVAQRGWTPEQDAQFMVVTAPGSTYEPGFMGSACAFHTVTSSGSGISPGIVYDFVPYQGDAPLTGECLSKGNPSLNPVYKTSKSASHEYSEAATNPIPSNGSWNSLSGAEIADLCTYHEDFEVFSGAWAQDLYDDRQNGCVRADISPPHVYAINDWPTQVGGV
ncbi:MAG TPA: hypothetical protein VLC51_10220, partial [Nitrospira sp.]|nr:hypothetical protein [Nitrospira sp.]